MTKKTIPYLETITLIEESVKNLNGLRGHNFFIYSLLKLPLTLVAQSAKRLH